jgi:MerR family transcriptional regulator, light-induced transcriptional regulator
LFVKGIEAEMKEFSIKDLESLTGIKAHTIRIWEQRYKLLTPARTGSNIRTYSGEDLKRLLNISLLNKNGVKISKIATMSAVQIADQLHRLNGATDRTHHYLSILKVAMMEYDEAAFRSVCEEYLKSHDFESLFSDVFLPFLNEIGYLWQTDTICPAQEHFVSNLIRQTIFVRTHNLPFIPAEYGKNIVLYLPENEIHEISLLMVNYIFRKRGHRTIFLGISVPIEDLLNVAEKLESPHFVSFFVTQPSKPNLPKYFKDLSEMFAESDAVFHLSGANLNGFESPDSNRFRIYPSVVDLISLVN